MKLIDKIKSTVFNHRALKEKILPLVVFLLPVIIILGIFMGYPVIYTIMRSFYDKANNFVGLQNYVRIFNNPRMLTALRNNALWVAIVPIIVTSLGLIFAVLTEKIGWAGLFKIILFIPLVVSGLAAGVIFRFMYANDPSVGFLNATTQAIVHTVQPPGLYPDAVTTMRDDIAQQDGGFILKETVEPGENANFGLARISPELIPDNAKQVQTEINGQEGINGVVWLDYSRGGGIRGQPEKGETGLPGVRVDLLSSEGEVVKTTYSNENGTYSFNNVGQGQYNIRLNKSTFRKPFGGFYWLGPRLVVPAVMFAYIWISTGLSLIIIKAGLSSINRSYMEAARIAGASEFQVFRYVTVPLLFPVLMVVFIRTVISVLKVFDLVLVIAPESVQANATVLALEMWRASFGGMRDFGLGSALATILFLLILPVVYFNIKRFRLND